MTSILAATLVAVVSPQIAEAAQPGEEGSAALVVGTETETETQTQTDGDESRVTTTTRTTPVAAVVVTDAYGGIKGKLRVHFDVDFLVQPRPNDYQDTAASQLARPLYGLGFGYGVHKNIVIGAKLAFNFTRVRDRSEAVLDADTLAVQRETNGAFTPYIEFLPRATGRILPFIGLRAGFAWHTQMQRTRTELAGMTFDAGARASELGPLVGLSGGAHFFLTPSFSLDAAALFDTRWTFGRTRALGDRAPDPESWAPAQSIMNLGLGLGLSAWF